MTILIDEKTKSTVPLALIDGKIYLDFLLKTAPEDLESETSKENISENIAETKQQKKII
ncbi:MAG: hypothetical protein L6V86_04570 [Treponema sp.]|nr:MAG: hypothetical protein L6V86_04570 [Treponema sp.]